MAALKEEARAEKEASSSADIERLSEAAATPSRKKRGRRPKDPPGIPKDKSRRNFTDPDSRIMKNSDTAFIHAYNAQAAVDNKS